MMNGAQAGEENVETFAAWIAAKTDPELRAMTVRGVLSRTEIAKECGFARSVLSQNPRVNAMLASLEAALRERGLLPPQVEQAGKDAVHGATILVGATSAAHLDVERMRRLEQENAGLRAELSELKHQLKKFAVLHEVLAETGRLPR
jgi:hypothetical protein